uniref:Ubiquitin-like domain-containing protein n=1 Tax=Alexandrium monilatum TaxID=311494 RepID=A0A7S4VLX3_9DINO
MDARLAALERQAAAVRALPAFADACLVADGRPPRHGHFRAAAAAAPDGPDSGGALPTAQPGRSTLELRISGVQGPLCTVRTEARVPVDFDWLRAAVRAATGILPAGQRLFQGTSELRAGDSAIGLSFPEPVELLLVQQEPHNEWLEALRRGGVRWLSTAPEEAKASREVILAAVATSEDAFEFACPELRADVEVQLALVRPQRQHFRGLLDERSRFWCSEDWQDEIFDGDREITDEAVKTALPEQLRSDRRFFHAWFAEEGGTWVAEFATDKLRTELYRELRR